MEEKRNTSLFNKPTVVTARRALGVTKTYLAIAAFFLIIAIVAWNPGNYVPSSIRNSTNVTNTTSANTVSNAIANGSVKSAISGLSVSGLPLLAVPLYIAPTLMLVTPVMMLFVYDKNNGVLEYLLSLGKTQRDIYMQYLKAALLLTVIFITIFVAIFLVYTHTVYSASVFSAVYLIPFLDIPFALAIVAFMSTCMMAFSSLQKTRVGSNQPLGLLIGWLGTLPAYIVPFVLTFQQGVYADLGISGVIAIISAVLVLSSGKLIRREKLLP